MKRKQGTSTGHSSIRILTIAWVLTSVVLGWMAWNSYESYLVDELTNERSARIRELRGQIIHLDEVLTMSARMAVATGDLRWEKRYRQFEPQLNDAIKEAHDLAQDFEPVDQTDAANIALVEMENQAFDLIRQHNLANAQALLFSDEYEKQKQIYAEGMAKLDLQLEEAEYETLQVERSNDLRHIAGALAAIPILLGGWFVVLRTLRRSNRQLTDLNRTLDQKVTERTKELQDSEEKFRTISTSAQDAIIMMDNHGNISYWNEAAQSIFGYTKDQALGQCVHTFLTPERFREAHFNAFPRFQKTGQGAAVGQTLELAARRKDGTEFPIEISLSAVQIKAQWHAIAIIRDVTERKRAEEQLRKLSLAVEQSPATVVITDTEGAIQYVNPMFTETTGYTAAEAIGQNPRILKSGEMLPEAYKEMWETITSGKIWRGEFHNKKKNGELFWEVASISPITNEEGEITHFLAVKEDITERKLAAEQLSVSEQKHRTLFESSRDAIMTLSPPTWKFTSGNSATIELFGVESEAEFVQLGPWDVSPEHQPDGELSSTKAPRMIEKAMKEGSHFFEWTHKRKDNEEFHATVLLTRVELGDKIFLQATVRDITERKQVEEELRSTNLQLERAIELANQMAVAAKTANTAKSEFLANMSHEIRTPMTAILGFSDVLLGNEANPSEKHEAAAIIRENGKFLLALINDILDLSKIEARKLEIEPVECSPHQIVSDVASTMRPRAIGKNVELKVEYAGAIPKTIQTDPTRLRQALINLVGNAIKFTEYGSVAIKAGLSGSSSDSKLLIEVIDTGVGIAADKFELIFEPFKQADTSTTRRHGGTGLGLTITKRIAKLLGGGLEFSSEVGKGSVFSLRISTGSLDGVELIEQPAVENGSLHQAEKQPATKELNCRILLVEDGEDNLRLISFILKKAGAEVETAENGKIGVEKALSAKGEVPGAPGFDVILMDMQMPVMDGYEATALLRQQGYTGPIIALTAHAMEGDQQKCLNAGCDAYASKPIDREKLFATIAEHLSKNITPQTTPFRVWNNDQRGSCHPAGENLLAGECSDDPGLRELVEGFVSELPSKLQAIEQAINEQDLELFIRLVHQLKDAAGEYGFPMITETTAVLEQTARQQSDLESLAKQIQELSELCRQAVGNGSAQAPIESE